MLLTSVDVFFHSVEVDSSLASSELCLENQADTMEYIRKALVCDC